MKLKDYYKNEVKINDSMQGGWASLYYGIFSKVIDENNYKNIVEVGIGYGTHAKHILNKNTNIEKLYLIDPMKYYPNDLFADNIMNQEPEVEGNNFNELYELINEELSGWNDKIIWLRKESLTVTEEEIPNNSVDCVFVDGDHSYEAVLNDLKFWWGKIVVGGQLMGDDYWMDDVKKAVKKFSEEYNIYFDLLTNENNNYQIFRFTKK